MVDIKLRKNEFLKINYLKEKLGTNNVSISSNKSYNEYETQTKKYVFDPQETGDYTIEYNSNSLTVKVVSEPDSGIARFNFENDVNDSWNGNNGDDYTGVGYGSGKIGSYSKKFNGSGRVSVPGLLDKYPKSYTITAWLYTNQNTSNGVYFSKENDTNTNNIIQFRLNSGSWEWKVRYGGSNSSISSSTPNVGEWYHIVAGQKQDGTLFAYINANSQGTTNASIPNSGSNRVAEIGEWKSNYQGWDGYIDDLRVYAKELSSTEISNLYNTGTIY